MYGSRARVPDCSRDRGLSLGRELSWPARHLLSHRAGKVARGARDRLGQCFFRALLCAKLPGFKPPAWIPVRSESQSAPGLAAGKCNFVHPPRLRASSPLRLVRGDRLFLHTFLCGAPSSPGGRAAWQTLRSCHPLISHRGLAGAPTPSVELGHGWGCPLCAGLVPGVPAAVPGTEPPAWVSLAFAEAAVGPADGSRCFRARALSARACYQSRTTQLEFLLTSRGSKELSQPRGLF